MKVMFISPYLTMKNIGASVGSWSHLNAIQKIVGKKNVTAVALRSDMKNNYEIDPSITIIDSYRNTAEKYRNILTLNGICMNGRVRRDILFLISQTSCEVIFIDESILGSLVKEIKREYPEKKVISFYHDIKADLCRQWIKKVGLKTFPYNCGLMLNEKQSTKYVDKKIVLNKRDSILLQHYYGCKADYYLPHFITYEEIDIKKYEGVKRSGLKLLFVGADYYPNVDGIKWFIKEVMPCLKNNIELWIVGRNMESKRNILHAERVNVVGTVQDLTDWYMKADIIISPIFVGGGMKTKTAEAFQYGKRIVATKESYEGYAEYLPHEYWGKYCWIANSAKDYIDILNSFADEQIEVFNKKINSIFLNCFSDTAGEKRMRHILCEE